MSLSQLVVEVPGGKIKSADWNNEFLNIYNNPITLISPTSGAINFNLQAHTNLLPATITASSATAGNVLAAPTSTGPIWTVLPLTGGLTSGVISSGTLFYVSSSQVLTPLPIGSSGQVLTVTSSLPAWGTAASGSGVGSLFLSHMNAPSAAIVTSSAVTLLSTTVPANTLSTNKSLRIVIFSSGNNNSGGQTFAYTITYGGTNLVSSATTTLFAANANHQAKAEVWITEQNSTAQQVAWTALFEGVSNSTAAVGQFMVRSTSNVDATIAQTLVITGNWSGAGAGQSATVESLTVESV